MAKDICYISTDDGVVKVESFSDGRVYVGHLRSKYDFDETCRKLYCGDSKWDIHYVESKDGPLLKRLWWTVYHLLDKEC